MKKIAYLRGLMEGLGVHPESREGRLFYAVCEALDETAEYAEQLEKRVAELEKLYEVLDEDLGAIEDLVDKEELNCPACPSSDTKVKYYYTETEKEPAPENSSNEETPELQDTQNVLISEEPLTESEENGELLDEEEYETICPTCGKVIVLDEHMLEEGETICPNCGEELEFDFDEEEIENLSPSETEE